MTTLTTHTVTFAPPEFCTVVSIATRQYASFIRSKVLYSKKATTSSPVLFMNLCQERETFQLKKSKET